MTREDLLRRHRELHRAMDELLACYVAQHRAGTPTLKLTLGEFLQWSHSMTQEPTCAITHVAPIEEKS
jgi:hypothetical protein